MELFEAVAARVSYRGMYAATPVPRADLRRIMEAGLAAPSGCNMQTTSLIGVDDPALVARLGGMLGKPGFASAPSAVCVLTQDLPSYEGVCFSVQDYSAAIQNMLLAAVALGYVSCWVEGYVSAATRIGEEMAAVLGVPAGYRLVAYLPVGVPAENGKAARKKGFAERAWFNGFGRGEG